MHLIILPGNNVTNRTWAEVMRDHYGPQFDSVYIQEYEHWASGEQVIDFNQELTNLKERPNPLFAGDDYVLFAKSVGSLLAFVAVEERVIAPRGAVLFGIPFDLAAKEIFQHDWSAVATWEVPTLAFHNIADPTTDYRFTVATLQQYAPAVELVTTHEPDHWYGDCATYDATILPFLNQLTR